MHEAAAAVALHGLIQPGCTGLIRIFVLIQPDFTAYYDGDSDGDGDSDDDAAMMVTIMMVTLSHTAMLKSVHGPNGPLHTP